MAGEITIRQPVATELLAERLAVPRDQLWNAIKNTCFKGAKDEELLALVIVCNQYRLNPFLKQIYAFPAKGGGIVPVVGVDGWISIAQSQDSMDGVEFEMDDQNELPAYCTCTIYRKNNQHPVKVTEYFKECVRPTEPWKQMPRRMLRHKAFIQCARLAFGLGGIFDQDEAADIMVNTAPTTTTRTETVRRQIAAAVEPKKAVARVVEPPVEETEPVETIDGEEQPETPTDASDAGSELDAALKAKRGATDTIAEEVASIPDAKLSGAVLAMKAKTSNYDKICRQHCEAWDGVGSATMDELRAILVALRQHTK